MAVVGDGERRHWGGCRMWGAFAGAGAGVGVGLGVANWGSQTDWAAVRAVRGICRKTVLTAAV